MPETLAEITETGREKDKKGKRKKTQQRMISERGRSATYEMHRKLVSL